MEPITRSTYGFCHGLAGADDFSDAHARHAALERGAKDAITISVEPARCGGVRKGVDHLLCGPLGRGMWRDVQMHDTTAMVAQEHVHEQHATRHRGHREEVHRCRGREVSLEECPPRL